MSDYQSQVRKSRNHWYVTSSQAKIYINGLWLDDCYDITYQYHESKQPVYGYNSKYFDDILPGQVLISGSFTINYRHDGYLSKILQKVTSDLYSGSYDKSVASSIKRKKDLEKAAADYRYALLELKSLKDKKDTMNKELLVLKDQGVTLKTTFLNTKNTAGIRARKNMADIDNAYENYTTALSNLSQEDKGIVEKWIDLHKKVMGQEVGSSYTTEEIKEFRSTMNLIFTGNTSQSVKDTIQAYMDFLTMSSDGENEMAPYDNGIQTAEQNYRFNIDRTAYLTKELGIIDTQIKDSQDKMVSLKAKTSQINEEMVRELAGEMSDALPDAIRAEDFNSGFDILIDYNGITHKVLKNCTLVGHSHAIMTSGEPIKEYYTFISRKIESGM